MMKNKIYYGLGAIKNVGFEAISNIVNERKKNGKFKSLVDFINRVDAKDVNKLQLEGLVKSGVFDEFDQEEDAKLEFGKGVSVVLDHMSYPYIFGSKIDYIENLMGSKFTVENPNASSTCGCGASFSI